MAHAHPKPAKLDAWIHLKVTTWLFLLLWPHSHLLPPSPFSLSVSPAILRFALDRSLCDMRIAPEQFQRLVRAAWSPQVGTCFGRYHPTRYYTESTRGIQRWGWLQWTADGKRLWGGTTNESKIHGSATMDHRNLYNLLIEGSLEVKLPTIWTDEKQSREEAERRERSKERRWRCAKR